MVDAEGGQTSYQYWPLIEEEKYVIDHYGNVTSKAYDARGRLTVETIGANLTDNPAAPATGYTTRTAYNALGAPTSMADPEGRLTTFSYYPGTTNPHIQTAGADAQNPSIGDKTTYTYHPGGEIATITDALGHTTTFNLTHNFSDPAYPGAVKRETTTVTDAERGVLRESHSYFDLQENRIAESVTRTLPDGTSEVVITRYAYDSEQRLTATFLPDGRVMETRYNAIGKEAAHLHWRTVSHYESEDESLARVTSMEYDTQGNLTLSTHPDGSTEQTVYDAENRPIATVDRMGRTTYTLYDKVGRVRFVIHPDTTMPPALLTTSAEILASPELADNPRRETRYDLIGRTTEEVDERGNLTEYIYEDGCGCAQRRKQTIAHLINEEGETEKLITHYEYDKSGNLRFVTDPRGNTIETQYDEQNRPRLVIYPATDEHPATQSETEFDALGRRSAMIDQEGKRTDYEYDALGRLIKVIQPAVLLPNGETIHPTTTYTYDVLGNQVTQTDANNHTTTYWTDSLGRRTKRVLPDGQIETMDYDSWGNLDFKIDFNGYRVDYEHDSMGRLESMEVEATHPSLALAHAPKRIVYTYYDDGRTHTATVFNATNEVLHEEVFTYDSRARLRTKESPQGTLTYGYDSASNLSSTYSSNGGGIALHYDYDSLNRLATLREGSPTASPLASYGYNTNGSLQKVAYANGLRQEYRYDTLNRLRYLDTLNAVDALVLGMEYQLKPSGHRHALLESSGRRTDWQFDAHYRLTQETISGDTAGPNGSVAYTYDAVGNRQTRTSTLGLLSNQSLSYNANDWLATDTYDSSGNTTASEGNADTYDFLNRLIRRITPTLALLDYEYNAEGILIAKTKNNNREEYHIDGNNPTGYAQVVETFFDTGSGLELTATHHYGHDLVSVYQTNGSTWQRHFYLYDGLGSVRALANEIGTVTDTYTYDAFGTLLHTAGSTANPYRYTGERFDPDLGMYYLRARYMNTNTGRFWTMDSYEGRNSDPNTLHKYLYANANPVMYVDPSGMVGLSFAMSLHTRLITFAAKWNYYAFASGGVVLGRYFQALGRISERVVNSVVMSYQNIFVLPSARIDHLFRIGNNLIAIETKYSAARPGTEGFHRLINQISYMASQPNVTQVYVYFTKEPTAAQLRHITNAAGNRFSIIVGPQQLDAILKSFGAQ